MAKQNLVFLLGRVEVPSTISINADGESVSGYCVLDVVRSQRNVGDGLRYIKHDHPIVKSKEKDILDKMSCFEENDIVLVKGVLTTARVSKRSFCVNCKAENRIPGNFVYVTPVSVIRIQSFGAGKENRMPANEYLINNSEMSNLVYVFGTLISDPKIFYTKANKQVCQFRIALNRKFRVRTDDPNIKTDYPYVKSYGDQARQDKVQLKIGAEILTDGFLQARRIMRTSVCPHCQARYTWFDNAMEIVAYTNEYLTGYLSEEDIETLYSETIETRKQKLIKESPDRIEYEDEKSDEFFDIKGNLLNA